MNVIATSIKIYNQSFARDNAVGSLGIYHFLVTKLHDQGLDMDNTLESLDIRRFAITK